MKNGQENFDEYVSGIADSKRGDVQVNVNDLSPATRYNFQVISYNQMGSSAPAEISAMTQGER
jgi:hypothetical protein